MINQKIALISLGCEKNLVDSEMILGFFNNPQFEIIQDITIANIIIINTCGFIEDAKKEAISTIYEMLEEKSRGAKIVVTGCLTQRYYDELSKEIPEVDLFIPIREYHRFAELIAPLLKVDLHNCCLSMSNRYLSTPSHLAYVKIAEGCNNCCSYCAIPLIRGCFVSRPLKDIVNEVKNLVQDGRKEICLISQDSTNYGQDIQTSLSKLITEICQIEGDFWIRLLYLYPDEITDELLDVIKNNSKVLRYFDIPVQHGTNKILQAMNRRGSKEYLLSLFNKIRMIMPDAIIRTTIMVGFPGEDDNDFEQLKKFIENVAFDHLGVFIYSKEEDTKSYLMKGQVTKKVQKQRYNEIMEMQRWLSLKQNKKHLNKQYQCIIEMYDHHTEKYLGRGYMFAPDDIDGVIYVDGQDLVIGQVYNIYIEDVDFYDLYATIK